eukprot:scaffold2671_cov252-Pinguiococcus_pyrenoidosus.AAC.5
MGEVEITTVERDSSDAQSTSGRQFGTCSTTEERGIERETARATRDAALFSFKIERNHFKIVASAAWSPLLHFSII